MQQVFYNRERMADKTVSFIQIYYDDAQLVHLYPFAIPHYNGTLTPYFENDPIQNIGRLLTSDLISICSWRLKEKRNGLRHLPDPSLSLEKITSQDYDVAILTPRSSSHQMLHMAEAWHGEAWTHAFNDLREFLNPILKVPREVTYPIYENHFIATKAIYHEYIDQCLSPCLSYMRDREVYFTDSGYINRKRGEEKSKALQRLQSELGRNDYPIAPFILERLFSIWLEEKKLKIINL